MLVFDVASSCGQVADNLLNRVDVYKCRVDVYKLIWKKKSMLNWKDFCFDFFFSLGFNKLHPFRQETSPQA